MFIFRGEMVLFQWLGKGVKSVKMCDDHRQAKDREHSRLICIALIVKSLPGFFLCLPD